MTLISEIRLVTGDEETVLASETAHIDTIGHTQTALAGRVARAGLDLLAGQTVLTQPLADHLSTRTRD